MGGADGAVVIARGQELPDGFPAAAEDPLGPGPDGQVSFSGGGTGGLQIFLPFNFHHADATFAGGGGSLEMAQGGDGNPVVFSDFQNGLAGLKRAGSAVDGDGRGGHGLSLVYVLESKIKV